jgi:integrase
VSLLALNGLRVAEALGADIDAPGLERGHRTLTVTRKGGKVVTMPLAPRVARVLDLAIGERVDGRIFVDPSGARLDRHATNIVAPSSLALLASPMRRPTRLPVPNAWAERARARPAVRVLRFGPESG